MTFRVTTATSTYYQVGERFPGGFEGVFVTGTNIEYGVDDATGLTLPTSGSFNTIKVFTDFGRVVLTGLSDDAVNHFTPLLIALSADDADVAEVIAVNYPGAVMRLTTDAGYAGSDFAERLIGTTGSETITGGGGNDSIAGRDGDDFLFGGADNDTLSGQDGLDELFGGAGDDKILGGDDFDQIFGGSGHDNLFGEAGNDLLEGGIGNDTIRGDEGEDIIHGWDFGENPNNLGGNNLLSGGDDNDFIFGGGGNDVINGDAGDDTLTGNNGRDLIRGGSGNDTIIVSGGRNDVKLGAGEDTVDLSSVADDFVFLGTDPGRTVVRDFNIAEDSIKLPFSNSAEFIDNAEQVSNGVLWTNDSGSNSVLFLGMEMSDLTFNVDFDTPGLIGGGLG